MSAGHALYKSHPHFWAGFRYKKSVISMQINAVNISDISNISDNLISEFHKADKIVPMCQKV